MLLGLPGFGLPSFFFQELPVSLKNGFRPYFFISFGNLGRSRDSPHSFRLHSIFDDAISWKATPLMLPGFYLVLLDVVAP